MGAWVLISASWYESPFCAGRLLVNRNDGAVDEGVLEIGVASHRIEKRLENARLRPSAEAPELGVPVAESRWQVTPGGPGANPPEHGLRKKPIVLRRCTRIAGFPWQIRLKSLPQPIRHHKPLLVHSNLHFGSFLENSARLAQCGALPCDRTRPGCTVVEQGPNGRHKDCSVPRPARQS
jgi:hypothetical protein